MIANYSPERREHAISWLRGSGVLTDTTLAAEAVTTAAIGLVICDESGRIKNADLLEACADPSIVNYAEQLIAEAGVDA